MSYLEHVYSRSKSGYGGECLYPWRVTLDPATRAKADELLDVAQNDPDEHREDWRAAVMGTDSQLDSAADALLLLAAGDFDQARDLILRQVEAWAARVLEDEYADQLAAKADAESDGGAFAFGRAQYDDARYINARGGL